MSSWIEYTELIILPVYSTAVGNADANFEPAPQAAEKSLLQQILRRLPRQ